MEKEGEGRFEGERMQYKPTRIMHGVWQGLPHPGYVKLRAIDGDVSLLPNGAVPGPIEW